LQNQCFSATIFSVKKVVVGERLEVEKEKT